MSPMDPVEAQAAAMYTLDAAKPAYVRLAKRGEPTYSGAHPLDIRSPHLVRDGSGTAIVFHGSIGSEVIAAYDQLRAKGSAPLVISVPMLQPLAVSSLLETLSGVGNVVCVEEHFVNCGLGSTLARLKSQYSAGWGLTLLGIPPQYIHEIGTTDELRSSFGISAADIVLAVETLQGGRRGNS